MKKKKKGKKKGGFPFKKKAAGFPKGMNDARNQALMDMANRM